MDDRDRALKAIITAGWANESDGDVQSPTGYFALIDLSTEREAIAGVLDRSGRYAMADAMADLEAEWFFTVENECGQLTETHGTKANMGKLYDKAQREYWAWLDRTEQDV